MTETASMGTPLVVLICVIFGIILAASMFKLDSLLSRPKQGRLPLAGGVGEDGLPIFLEPDGNPLRAKGTKRPVHS